MEKLPNGIFSKCVCIYYKFIIHGVITYFCVTHIISSRIMCWYDLWLLLKREKNEDSYL